MNAHSILPSTRHMAGPEPLADLVGDAQALYVRLTAPNPFLHPGLLEAAARQLGAMPVLAARANGALSGYLPLAPRSPVDRALGVVRSYSNRYQALGAPVVEDAAAAAALLDALAATGVTALALGDLALDGPDAALWRAAAAARGVASAPALERTRPVHATLLGREAYRRVAISPPHRKALDRKARRLAGMGALTHRVATAGTPEGHAAGAAFLALEASGWKGRAGTALASRPATRAYAEALFAGPPRGPDLVFEVLALDGRPIAINVTLVSGGTGFTIKSAFDEALAGFSPGAVLDDASLALASAGGPLRRLDSCATDDHPIARLYAERERHGTLLIGLSPKADSMWLTACARRLDALEAWRENARRRWWRLRRRFSGPGSR